MQYLVCGKSQRLDSVTPLAFRYSVMGSKCTIYSNYLECSHSFLEIREMDLAVRTHYNLL